MNLLKSLSPLDSPLRLHLISRGGLRFTGRPFMTVRAVTPGSDAFHEYRYTCIDDAGCVGLDASSRKYLGIDSSQSKIQVAEIMARQTVLTALAQIPDMPSSSGYLGCVDSLGLQRSDRQIATAPLFTQFSKLLPAWYTYQDFKDDISRRSLFQAAQDGRLDQTEYSVKISAVDEEGQICTPRRDRYWPNIWDALLDRADLSAAADVLTRKLLELTIDEGALWIQWENGQPLQARVQSVWKHALKNLVLLPLNFEFLLTSFAAANFAALQSLFVTIGGMMGTLVRNGVNPNDPALALWLLFSFGAGLTVFTGFYMLRFVETVGDLRFALQKQGALARKP